MSATWTTERVISLAPDAASASAGQGLGAARKWVSFARSERAIWGLCQGSGKSPYQTRVDLSEPAFKCSCPSRKFPCKHGLGLMLLFAKEEKAFRAQAEPGWVTEWIESRAERAEKKAEKAQEAAAKAVDEEAQAKRAAQRESRVKDGAAECRVWLEDLVRRGLAAAQSEPEEFWERSAARMVDAQAPGLARLIRQLPGVMASGEGWPRRVLDRLGRMHLLLRAVERIEALPPDLAADVRIALGKAQPREEALATDGVADRWCVVGQVMEEEERLRVRRSWLVGRESGRRALVLDYAAGGQPMDATLVAGMEFEGEVAFYPARLPLRALVKSRSGAARAMEAGLGAESGIETELSSYARALSSVPWLERWPIMLTGCTPRPDGTAWLLRDREGATLPVRPGFAGMWKLMALSGGRPLSICGEWDGEFISPLAAWGSGLAFEDIAPRWAA